MNQTKHPTLFKVSLLSISILLMSAPVIAAALPLMFSDFTTQPKSAVEMLLTIPNFGIILALLISPLSINLLGKKKTIVAGLVIALISGILPAFVLNFPLILFSRFMFGVGIGLFNSLAVSLLAEFYHGDELSTMMGYQSMAGSLGSAMLSFGISYLVTFGWQATFLIYLVILPVLILFISFVKIQDTKVSKLVQSQVEEKERIAFNRSVIGLAVLIFFVFAFFMTSVIKLPEYILSKNMTTASGVSIISGLSTLVGIPMGLFYGKFHKILQQKILPIGLFVCGLGFACIGLSSVLFQLILGVILIGCGFGLSIPFIYTWTAQVAPKRAMNISYTVLIIATNIGVFCSPILLNGIGSIIGDPTPEFSMFVASFGLLTLGLIMSLKLFVFTSHKEEIK